MAETLSDLLLQELSSERADALVLELGSDIAVRVNGSTTVTFVHFVLEGTAHFRAEGANDSIALRQGECAVVMYGSAHSISAMSDSRRVPEYRIGDWPIRDEPLPLKIGKGQTKAKILSAALQVVHRPDRSINVHLLPELVPLKHEMESASAMGTLFSETSRIAAACHGPGASAFVNALMNLVLTHFLRCSFEQQTKVNGPTEKLWLTQTRHVGSALRMLKTHPEKNWTVASLARELGYSRSTFANLFHTHMGVGPMEYLGRIRMEMAADLLRSTPGLSINLLARRAGYGSGASFSRAFKAHHGVSPRAFCDDIASPARLDE